MQLRFSSGEFVHDLGVPFQYRHEKNAVQQMTSDPEGKSAANILFPPKPIFLQNSSQNLNNCMILRQLGQLSLTFSVVGSFPSVGVMTITALSRGSMASIRHGRVLEFQQGSPTS